MLLRFDERLKKLRMSKKLSQTAIAEKLGIKRSSVSSWEQGVCEPTIKHAVELSYIFNCSLDYLLSIDDREYIEVTGLNDEDKKALNIIVKRMKQNK